MSSLVKLLSFCGLSVFALAAASCTQEVVPPDRKDGDTGGDTRPVPDTRVDAAEDTAPPEPDTREPPTPFFVTARYIPSGYMGYTTGITMVGGPDAPDCGGKRANDSASGYCYKVDYVPSATPGTSTDDGWAGVYWLFPEGNWKCDNATPGTLGFQIPSGYTKVSFYARGAVGDEVVSFGVGLDTDRVTSRVEDVSLTAEWKPYTIDLTGKSWTFVCGAFYWMSRSTKAIAFYVDDIKWE